MDESSKWRELENINANIRNNLFNSWSYQFVVLSTRARTLYIVIPIGERVWMSRKCECSVWGETSWFFRHFFFTIYPKVVALWNDKMSHSYLLCLYGLFSRCANHQAFSRWWSVGIIESICLSEKYFFSLPPTLCTIMSK